jgi:hypothetical protein
VPMSILGVGAGRSTRSMAMVEAPDGVAGGVVLFVSMSEYDAGCGRQSRVEEERWRHEPGRNLHACSKKPTSAASHLESKRAWDLDDSIRSERSSCVNDSDLMVSGTVVSHAWIPSILV